jgi:glycosyltransferase involved in cell wall biosynthesis
MGRDEAFGNVYVEALGTGLPVVAHDSSTTRWIFQKPNHAPRGGAGDASDPTWLVDTADSAAVTSALKAALACPCQEPQRRHTLAADRFSWKKVALQYGAFFKETAQQ